MIGSILMRLNV